MRIDQIKLVRFGEFADWEVGDLQPGLNALFGPNETGKSTLLGAIRFLLFGSAGRQSGVNQYEPDGDKRHVEAILWHDGTLWHLTRRDVRGKGAFTLKPADGGPNVLLDTFNRDWLGNTSRGTYQSVYALGLDDLQWCNELRDVILVQADPMGEKLRDAIKETEKATAQAPVKHALAAWKKANDEVLQLSQQPAQLNDYERQLSRERQRVAELDEELAGVRKGLARCREILDARETWNRAASLRTQLEPLADVAEFPLTAERDYQAARERHDEARTQADEARSRAQSIERELDGLWVDETLLTHAGAVEKLADEAAQHRELPGQLQEAEQRAEMALAAARQEADCRCGHDADIATLRNLDTSATTQSKLEEAASALSRAETAHAQAKKATDDAARAREQAEEEVAEVEKALDALPEPVDVDALRARVEQVERWQALQVEWRLACREHKAAQQKHDDLVAHHKRESEARAQAEAQARRWEDDRAAQEKAMASAARRRRSFSLAGGVLFLLAAVAGYALGQTWAPYCLIGAACLIAIAFGTPAPVPLARQPLPPLPELTVTPEQLQNAAAELARAGEAANQVQTRLAEAAAAAQLPEEVTEAVVEARRQELVREREEAQAAMVRRKELETRLQSAQARQKRAAEELERLEAEEHRAQDATEKAQAAWGELLQSLGLPPEFQPGAARTYLDGARVVQARLREHDERSAEAKRLRERLERFREEAETLAATLGQEIPADDPWGLHAARQWRERLKEERENDLRRRNLLEKQREAGEQCKQAEATADEAERQMEEVLRGAQAADENDLLRRVRDHEEWTRLTSELREVESQLRSTRSEEEWQEFLQRLESADWDALEQEAAKLTETEVALVQERDQAQQSIGSLQDAISKLRQDEALAEAQARREEARARVVQLRRAWAPRTVAHALLTLTRRDFEAQRQPEAVRRTGALFEEVTGGRWGRIIASDGAVRVLREENGRVIERDEERLSRGARDALMLCARLAAIEQAVDRLPLPVVLDDALVNLDRRRHERALRIVARLAEKTQVLLFTCHEHTMALLRDAGVAHHPILLPGKASAGA